MRFSHREASLFSLRGLRKIIKRKAARRLALRVPCASRSGEGFSDRSSEGFSDRSSSACRKTRGLLAAPVRTCSLLICDAWLRLRDAWILSLRYYSMQSDLTAQLQAQARAALAREAPLRIAGGDTKAFLGRAVEGDVLDVTAHRGIVNYQPTELVITARAGTPLIEIESALEEHKQMLAFEPPHFGERATLGGTIACGLSGPRRAYTGAARDFVLGMQMINGHGEVLRFGGEVMKNVAGYDVSRLMTGAMGTLGVILEVSLKVLPRPAYELTLAHACATDEAIAVKNRWAWWPLPITATCHVEDTLYVRLSGAESAVESAHRLLGGEVVDDADVFWAHVREHRHHFFSNAATLWRISVPSATPPLALTGESLLEWGGALRWLRTAARAAAVRTSSARAGGHAFVFRGKVDEAEVFHPLPSALLAVQQRVKHAFDPKRIFNGGRMYADL